MRALWGVLLVAAAGCLPDVDVDESRITAPRVLALRADPAEATPGTATTFTALVAGPDGTIADAALDWAYCTARRPLAELGPVNRACYAAAGDALVSIGVGARAAGPLPRTGCRLFGPEVPPAQPGETPGRTVDADLTGGYQQPVRVLGPGGTSILATRISCGAAGATPEQARAYRQGYRDNAHPHVAGVGLLADDGRSLTPGTDGVTVVAAGRRVGVRVTWPECPDATSCSDGACEPRAGAERYLLFDPVSHGLVTRREALRVAWYASAGVLDLERSGRAADDLATVVDNGWQAPATPGRATLWVVLRDDRGGVEWAEVRVEVQLE